METSLYRNVSTFLDFALFFESVETFPHFLILSSFQYVIIVSIPHNRIVWNTKDDADGCSLPLFFSIDNNVNISSTCSKTVHT